MITSDDVLTVLKEEAEEDLLDIPTALKRQEKIKELEAKIKDLEKFIRELIEAGIKNKKI